MYKDNYIIKKKTKNLVIIIKFGGFQLIIVLKQILVISAQLQIIIFNTIINNTL
jgi:hypothetical protein